MSTDNLTPTPSFADDTYWEHPHHRRGFFTDTSICIGCKACEVACKEWNLSLIHISEPTRQVR